MVVTLGALMADVAHSRPIPVSATSDSEDTRHRHDLEMSTYEGPTGIVGVLADAATQVGRAVGLLLGGRARTTPATAPRPRPPWRWSAGSRTSSTDPSSTASSTRTRTPGSAASTSSPASDTEVAEYVESLEEAQDTADLPEASGDAIAKEFERYLRRRGTDES